jgi:lipopolysaccharide transport system ATP-binding protein
MKQSLGIEIEDLRKVYPQGLSDQLVHVAMAALGRPSENIGGGVALDGLTVSIRQGERVGIIGRNGAGKSTLLQMLAGITEPTSGLLKINGKVTAVLTLGVGLREDLSGLENIYLNGAIQDKSQEEIDNHVSDIVEFAELGKFINLPLRTYSTGMKARLAFSIITQIDPEILIIDEALSVGDAAFSVKAGKRIAQLCAKGSIVLIVSHSMKSIRELCNRCLWLDQGMLIRDGSPEDVTKAYLESVREADEADHAARFNSLVGVRNHVVGYNLSPLKLTSTDQQIRRLTSGAPLCISCEFEIPTVETIGIFYLRCIRLDGALICEHVLASPACNEFRKLIMTYPQFNLAAGLYRFVLEWQEVGGKSLVESSTVLEVISDEVPTGGRPVLLDVGEIESIQIGGDI